MKNIYTLLITVFITGQLFSQGSGKSYNPNGTSHYIDLGASVSSNVRTIEIWIRPDQNIDQFITTNKSLVVRNSSTQTDEYGLYFIGTGSNDKGKLSFFYNNGSNYYDVLSDNDTWSAQQWYHIAAVIDAANGMQLYVNGVLQSDSEAGFTSPIATNNDQLSIATWGDSLTDYFPSSQIDEIRFWTTARSQAEIRDNMCKKLTGSESGLQAYYRCDDGSGTTLTDLTSNGYDGTLSGAAWTTSSAPIGDDSAHNFPSGSWNGETISISGGGDVFTVNSVQHGVAPPGGHVYRVDAVPNNTLSITGLGNNEHYFGVYIPGGSGVNYSIEYDYSGNSDVCPTCASDAQLFTRNDNAIPGWLSLAASNDDVNRVFTKSNESSTGIINRAEYILGSAGAPLTTTSIEKRPVFSLYPNPAHEQCWITVEEKSTITVTDITGQIVMSEELTSFKNQLTLSHLPAGSYFVQINDQAKILVVE